MRIALVKKKCMRKKCVIHAGLFSMNFKWLFV